MQRTGNDVRRAVIEQLAADARVNAQDLEVSARDGQVTLRGVAPSYRAKWAAAEAARRVRGVYSVDNEIQVRVPAPSDDDRVAMDIRNALMRDADIDSSNINVDVHEGQVVLRGTVSSAWAKSRAEDHARSTAGVANITNDLALVPDGSREDREIATEVEAALRRDPAVDADLIDVEVADRRVVLSGVVRSWAERNAAMEDAIHVRGVVDVADSLWVRRT